MNSENNSEKLQITIVGRPYSVVPADCALRNLHMIAYAEPQRYFFHSGYYCWNDRCKSCLITLKRDGEVQEKVQACKLVLQQGDKILALPENMPIIEEESTE